MTTYTTPRCGTLDGRNQPCVLPSEHGGDCAPAGAHTERPGRTKTRIRQAILCAIAVGLVLLVPNARGAQAVVVVFLAILFVAAAQRIGRPKPTT